MQFRLPKRTQNTHTQRHKLTDNPICIEYYARRANAVMFRKYPALTAFSVVRQSVMRAGATS